MVASPGKVDASASKRAAPSEAAGVRPSPVRPDALLQDLRRAEPGHSTSRGVVRASMDQSPSASWYSWSGTELEQIGRTSDVTASSQTGLGSERIIVESAEALQSAAGLARRSRDEGQQSNTASRSVSLASSAGGIFELDTDAPLATQQSPPASSLPCRLQDLNEEAPLSASPQTPAPASASYRAPPSSFIDPFATSRASRPVYSSLAAASASHDYPPSRRSSQHPPSLLVPSSSAAAIYSSPSSLPSQNPLSAEPPSSLTALARPHPTSSTAATSSASKLGRSPFDTTPSFSSPLAHALTVTGDATDDLELDRPKAATYSSLMTSPSADRVGSVPPSPKEVESSLFSLGSAVKQQPSSPSVRTSLPPWKEQDHASPELSPSQTGGEQQTHRSHQPWQRAPLPDGRRISSGSSTTSFRRTSNDSSFQRRNPSIESQPKTGQVARALSSKRAAASMMGPPLNIPHRHGASFSSSTSSAPLTSISTSPDNAAFHAATRGLSMRGGDDHSSGEASGTAQWARSVSGASLLDSPVLSVSDHSPSKKSTSPVVWDAQELTGAGSVVPGAEGRAVSATTARRRTSSLAAFAGGGHRRARSLGGALLGGDAPTSSTIGGPDGVDPNLVAAIRAGDASIPGTPMSESTSSSNYYEVSGPAVSSKGVPSTSISASLSSPNAGVAASLPTTPSGFMKLQKKLPGLLTVQADTRALANTYPSMAVQSTSSRKRSVTTSMGGTREEVDTPASRSGVPSASEGAESPVSSLSPSSATEQRLPPIGPNAPANYGRSRTRSQTIAASPTHSPRASYSALGASTGATGSSTRSSQGLGDAIRLQRVPTSVRLAGDLFISHLQASSQPSAQGTSNSGGHRLSQSISAKSSASASSSQPQSPITQQDASAHGLGIGMHGQALRESSPVLPATPQASPRPSPQHSVAGRGASIASSANVSPVILFSDGTAGPVPPLSVEASGSLLSSGSSSRPLIPSQQEAVVAQRANDSSAVGLSISLGSGTNFTSATPIRSANYRKSRASASSGSAYAPLLSVSPSQPHRLLPLRHAGDRRSFGPGELQRPMEEGSGNFSHDTTMAPPCFSLTMDRNVALTDTHQQSDPTARQSSHRPRGRLSLSSGVPLGQSPLTPGGPEFPAVTGTDDYARFIIQSRTAKMQKWRSSTALKGAKTGKEIGDADSTHSSEEQDYSYAGSDFQGRRGTVVGLPGTLTGPRGSNASAADLLKADNAGDPNSTREIEWVDWLDEYRKMKEAKLRTEQEEQDKIEPRSATTMDLTKSTHAADQNEGQFQTISLAVNKSHDATVRDNSANSGMSTFSWSTGDSDRQRRQFGKSSSAGEEKNFVTPITPLSVDALRRGLGGGTPRRPSEPAGGKESASSTTGSKRIWPSAGPLLSDLSPVNSIFDRRDTSTTPLDSERSRNASMSPVTSRTTSASTSAGMSGFNISSTNSSSGPSRKRRNLGGRIEAWWGAVKSNFAQPGPVSPVHHRNASGGHMGAMRPYDRHSPKMRGEGYHRHASQGAQDEMKMQLHSRPVAFATPRALSMTLQRPLLRGASSTPLLVNPELRGTETKMESSRKDPLFTSPRISTDTSISEERGRDSVTITSSRGSSRTSTTRRRNDTNLTLTVDQPVTNSPSPTVATTSEVRRFSPSHSISSSAIRGEGSRSPLARALSPPLSKSSPLASGASHLPESQQQQLKRPILQHRGTSESASESAGSGRQGQQRGAGGISSKDITIQSVRRHIRHRLAASKESCDKELHKIINAVSLFVESSIEDKVRQDPTLEAESDAGDDDLCILDTGMQELHLDGISSLAPGQRQAVAASFGGLRRATSQLLHGSTGEAAATATTDLLTPPEITDPDETPRAGLDADNSTDMAPTPRRTKPQTSEPSGYSLPPLPNRTSVPLSLSSSMPGTSMALAVRNRASRSVSSSRPTSRSHSPMPGSVRGELSQFSPHRKTRCLPAEDLPLEPYVPALQDIVGLALEVSDTPITTLTARSGICSEIIAQVQAVGQAWDEHPEWPGRGWYVQLLLAVAGLSRVVEWWEAEKGFWNFDDEDEPHDAQPISFGFGQSGFGQINLDGDGILSGSPAKARQSLPFGIAPLPLSTHPSSAASSPALDPQDRRVFSEGDRSRLSQVGLLPAATTDNALRRGSITDFNVSLGLSSMHEDESALQPAANVPRPPPQQETPNILMELSLDQERVIYVSPAWRQVVGTDPAMLMDTPIIDLLAPNDVDTFAEATRQLQQNESHTVEIAFRLLVSATSSEDGDESTESLNYYQEMEGKGMLMRDRGDGQPTHTMWVFKPVSNPEPEADLSSSPHKVAEIAPAAAITAANICTDPLLCRICERDVPTWFFEKHSEICNEIHRLEMEIGECNEGLSELRRTIRAITARLENTTGTETPAEYRGALLSTPAPSNEPPSAIEHLKLLSSRPLPASAVRKSHFRALEAALEILQTAKEISTPTIKEDDLAETVDKQRLLSPTSENRIVQVRNWQLPLVEDPALEVLMVDVMNATRNKLSVVNRTLNTIVYVETVRLEWEERVDAALAAVAQDESVGSSSQDDYQEGLASSDASNDAEPNRFLDPPLAADLSVVSETGETSIKEKSEAEQDEEDAAETSAILLERDDRDDAEHVPVPPSGPLSLRGFEADVEEYDEIPEVESHMGGSAAAFDQQKLEGGTTGIPIPKTGGAAALHPPAAHPLRELAVSPLNKGPGNISVPSTAAQATVSVTHRRSRSRSRRQSSIDPSRAGNLLYTPPLSPKHSPSDNFVSHAPSTTYGSAMRRVSTHRPSMAGVTNAAMSPRLPPAAPSSRPTASSIKDFDILKPISKGAFGSVFLAKKRTTGDYYAIKVLKKSDMIAKNQITNVKAERMILMTQTQSPFVVKLYFTFQSKEYLYLVMEYLPGGDCASLVKMLGGLDEQWAKQYLAEVVNGLEQLHAQGVVHRDLKPDNLLIDQRGHLKVTDFGLSKIGLLGRQTRPAIAGPSSVTAKTPFSATDAGHSKSDSLGSSVGTSGPGLMRSTSTRSNTNNWSDSPLGSSPMTPGSGGIGQSQAFFVAPTHGAFRRIVSSESSGSDLAAGTPGIMGKPQPIAMASSHVEGPGTPFRSHMFLDQVSPSGPLSAISGGSSDHQQQVKKIVGTPDYLAPESILGIGMDDKAVDWWALGVILYEFIYGYPPFHAETPNLVFDNILSRNIDWEEDTMEISSAARDLMERLMCTDPKERLGSRGMEEIKAHPFFEGIDWQDIVSKDGPFVPQVTDPESTDYFDLRGAMQQDFAHEFASQAPSVTAFAQAIESKRLQEPNRTPSRLTIRNRLDRSRSERVAEQALTEDFGSFSYKNLSVLKQANDEVIRKMRDEQQLTQQLAAQQKEEQQAQQQHQPSYHSQQNRDLSSIQSQSRNRSLSAKLAAANVARAGLSQAGPGAGRPPSPALSVSTQSSGPLRTRQPTSPARVSLNASSSLRHKHRASDMSSCSGSGSNNGSPAGTGTLVNTVMERKRSQLAETDVHSMLRKTSLPTRLRTASLSTTEHRSSAYSYYLGGGIGSGSWKPRHSLVDENAEQVLSEFQASGAPTSTDGRFTINDVAPAVPECLVAEDNPISQRLLCQVLGKLGCKCTTVRNGADAVRLAMADTVYAALFIDLTLPIVNGQDVARMIKSTRNANSQTTILALAPYDKEDPLDVTGSVFDGCIAKPVDSADVRALMPAILAHHALSVSGALNGIGTVSASSSEAFSGAEGAAGNRQRARTSQGGLRRPRPWHKVRSASGRTMASTPGSGSEGLAQSGYFDDKHSALMTDTEGEEEDQKERTVEADSLANKLRAASLSEGVGRRNSVGGRRGKGGAAAAVKGSMGG